MEPVITRHDTAIRPVSAPAAGRVDVVSFDVDGPSAMVDRFVEVGLRLQRATPGRIPQDSAVARHRLSSDFGWYRTGRARHFVASVEGRDVARCSAMLDDHQRATDGTHVGLVGQWECEPGEAGDLAAAALLELATGWLRELGARDVVGPIDFATWYGYRFVEGPGDGRAPLLTEPVTDAGSIARWEAFGFRRDETYFSAEIADPAAMLELARPIAKQLIDDGWRIRQLRLRDWDETIAQVHAMSMAEFTRQPYFTPIELADFAAMYESVRRSVDPRFVFTAWSPDGELGGFVFGVRELGVAAREVAAGGRTAKFRAARAAWRADTMLVKTICVGREHRRAGVTILLQHALYAAAFDTGHRRFCNLLMHGNNRSRDLTALAGGEEFRSYVTLRLPG